MAEPSLRYRRLDPQGDMVLGNGSGTFLTGVEAKMCIRDSCITPRRKFRRQKLA